ncbi:rho guanine nucleotide exchange factor 19-like isoform X2 [Denticeps clupeoides]|uniref:rho guanine nucleotide exchange factor 19-like isoform X2 n=1 Tax=Denticeps clupeoides TaxID=299321 RepID=UPI0010A57C55|nr:rho guanine nucleotide exchange factor 19-like isoform X2 [Denticeps clupeoides]
METRQYSDKAGQRTYRDISPRPNPRSGEQRRAKAGDVLKDRTRDRRKEMGRDERGLHREGEAHTLSVSNKRAYLDLDNLEAMEADQPVSQGEAGQHCHAHENGSAKTPSAEHEEKDTDGHVREEIEHSSEKAISEHNKDFEAALDTRSAAEEGHHGNIVNKETEESPEEGTECQGECEETKREEEGRERHESFEVEDTWTTAEEPKRHSQALHVKWAQNILCDIMGSPEAEGPAHSFKNTEELIEGVVHAGSPAHTRQTGGNIDNGAEPSRQAEVSIFIQAECEEEEVENMGRQGDRETEGSEQSSHTESEMEAEPISPPLGLSDEESVKKGAEKGTKEVKKDGHLLHSTKSFSEVGNSPTFRRKGFRKTLEKNKEEHEEGLGRDRRTRVFHSSEDEDDPLSYTWGEMDLKSSASAIGIIRKRNSKYFNSQLYQQYSEVVQNRELLRQTETLYSYDDSGTTPTPSPAQRPLPPVPSKPYPYTINKSGSFASHTLPLPIPHGRRPPSPRLSISSQSPTLWQHLPGVKNNPEMEEMSEDQRQLQEVRFEVVTSEASYCHSLDIVVEHFVKSKQLGLLLSTQDRKWLFSRLSDVRAISHSFLSKLEERVENDPLQFTVCDIIIHHCPMFRMVYVPYLTNQSYQDKTYQRLMDENSGFKRCVEKLERSSVCQRLPLRSFLVLPFQRITRLKLLVQNIVKRTAPKTEDETQAIKAMKLLEKMIQESNDSITQMKSIESLVSLSAKVDFECKTLPLVSQSRQVVREGPVKEMRDFSMKENERALYIHLFNDYLLLSLYKEGGRFTVIDHAPVSELRAENCRLKLISLQANLFRLHLANKALLLRTDTQSDKLRWISALSRPHPEIDFITAQDIPQMQCIRAYITQQPDELNLEKAEVILAHQQSSDGWVEGTRMSDRQRGWVPESHLELITSEKARQRNLMDSHKITTATAAL